MQAFYNSKVQYLCRVSDQIVAVITSSVITVTTETIQQGGGWGDGALKL